MEYELKPCPFCGGEAEISRRRSQNNSRVYFETADDANAYINECRAKYDICESSVERWYNPYYGKCKGNRKEGWYFRADYRYTLYNTRCKDVNCIGRICRSYSSKREAIEAWNRRAKDGEE